MKEFGEDWLFPSIEDAVTFASEGNRVVSKTIYTMIIPLFQFIVENKSTQRIIGGTN